MLSGPFYCTGIRGKYVVSACIGRRSLSPQSASLQVLHNFLGLNHVLSTINYQPILGSKSMCRLSKGLAILLGNTLIVGLIRIADVDRASILHLQVLPKESILMIGKGLQTVSERIPQIVQDLQPLCHYE